MGHRLGTLSIYRFIHIEKKPSLIISPDEYNKDLDVVIAFITSNMKLKYRTGDHKICEWKKANLPKPSMIRMKFATINKTVIIKRIGKLLEKDIEIFSGLLVDFFSNK